MPEDTFAEKESFRCQPRGEKGLWNAEIHQTTGIDAWIRNVHRAVIRRELQISCLLMFGTYNANWHSVGIKAPLIWWARMLPSMQGEIPSCWTANFHRDKAWGGLARTMPLPTLSTLMEPASHQCVVVTLIGLGMRQLGFKSYTCCSGSGTLGKLT